MKLFPVKAVVVCLFIFTGCKKDKDKDTAIRIEGFDIYDQVGVPVGHIGPNDNDWTFNNTLTQQELALFEFMPSDVNLNNTAETAITGNRINPYPNPISTQQRYTMNAMDSVLLKMVVVNNKLEVLGKLAVKIKGSTTISLDFSNRAIFKNKAALRAYFSFSATDKPNFKAGYGDIKICEGADNCF